MKIMFLIFTLLFLNFYPGTAQAEGYWFQEEDLEIYYRYWPAVCQPRGSLLLIHGLGGSTFSWHVVAPPLARAGYEVYAIDLPGFGLSPAADTLDLSRGGYAAIAADFWQAVEPPAPHFLVGHSMGGGIVTQMVGEEYLEPEGLILLAPALQNGGGGSWTRIFGWRPVRQFGGWFMSTFFLSEKRVYSILESAYGREPSTLEFQAYYEPLLREGALATLLKMTADNRRSPAVLPEKIEIRTLFLWGADDTWVAPPCSVEELKTFSRYSLKIIPEGGHLIAETQGVQVLDHILHFLGGKSNDSGEG